MNKKLVQNGFGGELPLVVIVGPTASGKTGLAIKLAKQFNGEVICADSRTIYKHMNIGTAKPSQPEQQGVKHWGLDLVEPDENFSAADFKKYALQKIAEIRGRGHVPFLVGGTGLYIDGVIFNYEFGKPAQKLRAELEKLSLGELILHCENNNIELPKNTQNRRQVIRAIEQGGVNNKRLQEPIANTLVVGIATDAAELKLRIAKRSEQLFELGVVDEAKMLGKNYGWDCPAMSANVYKFAGQYLNGEVTSDEFIQKNNAADWQLARRQKTWFKRNQFINWLSLSEAEKFIVQCGIIRTVKLIKE